MVPNDPYGERLFMEAAAANGNLDNVTAAIVSHRSSYVNESDFQLMSKNGINAVRAGFARRRQRALLVSLMAIYWWQHATLHRQTVFVLGKSWQAARTTWEPRIWQRESMSDIHAQSTKATRFAQVRVPVGYWLFARSASDAPPFVPGASTYLDTVFEWGAQYGIGVLVDMHAAPSSQNGCVLGSSPLRRGGQAAHRAGTVQACRPCCVSQCVKQKWSASVSPALFAGTRACACFGLHK